MTIKIASRQSEQKINEKWIKQAENGYRREKPENYSYGSRFQHVNLKNQTLFKIQYNILCFFFSFRYFLASCINLSLYSGSILLCGISLLMNIIRSRKFDMNQKGTHRQSRWFFICGPCPRILATRHVASVNLPLANCPYRRPVNGLELTKHCQLVSVLVFLQLILDIRCNSCRIFSSRVYIVTSTPKFPVTVFELE